MPILWLQSVNSLFVILFAPIFGMVWIALGKRGLNPSSPAKFTFGLLFAGLGFLVMVSAAERVIESGSAVRVSMMWLSVSYLLQTFGELALSPVGLSSMTKLAPPSIVSLMMGVWFLGASVGNFLGGMAAGYYESLPLPRLFGVVALMPVAAGIAMFLYRRSLTRLIGDSR